ncbi:hypothetical protein DPMN_134636 [Dreissena polymorpha]|uniref:Uncharacterized protein n=1 Tax=Dreissena polymorpha TaxID=45954 RepID=A0A9D4JG00_DREPO|nr:hypothetical protein DPMN_134636 [Dreissena polymorpha]
MAPPARVPVKEFQRACEEVLNKGSQPAPKRQRLEKETSGICLFQRLSLVAITHKRVTLMSSFE